MSGNSFSEDEIDSMNRRKVLRTAVAAGGIGGLGMFSSMPVGATETDNQPFTITDAHLKDADAAVADRVALEKTTETSELAAAMRQDTGRESGDPTISYSLETEERQVQQYSPAITAVPMKPKTKEWNEVSISDISVQFALTIEQNGRRTPVSALGMSYESSDLTTTGDDVTLNIYGSDDSGNVSVVEKSQVSAPNSNDLGTNGLGCDGCKVVVGAICVGVNGTLGRAGCVSRCVPIVISNPLIGTGCAGLCYALTSTLGKIACGSGGLSEAACRTIDFC